MTPLEVNSSLPPAGETITNKVSVRAKETDPNSVNNSTNQDTLVTPNPNVPPIVTLTSPTNGSLIVGPADLSISATASDSDGTINTIRFFDNDILIGNGVLSGANSYSISEANVSFGQHTIVAVAVDNGGKTSVSNGVHVIINGTTNMTITGPASGTLVSPGTNLAITTNATNPAGINQVELFANQQSLGIASLTGNQYLLNWANVSAGHYSIVAVATDGSDIKTTSAPIQVTIDNPPTINFTKPINGATFPTATNIGLSATAQSTSASVRKVDFYANGTLVGTANEIGIENFLSTWRNVTDGIYSLTAVATDSLGITTTSAPITIGVNTPSPRPGEFIWFDDDLPQGAVKHADGDVDWYWVDANPSALSGTRAHQSRNFGQLAPPNGFHQHSFDGATAPFPVNAGDKLFTYIFLDVNNMPREIMLKWKDGNGWEHRAYWGANNIAEGTDGTTSRQYMGPLPESSTWVRLEVPASSVGLEGATLTGMAFALDGGRATFDLAGKTTASAPPPPTTEPGDFVWIEDSTPAGAVAGNLNIDDTWNWVPGPVYSGQSAHQSYFRNNDNKKFRQHGFTGAQTPMVVNPGDVLFTYVYLGDPDLNHQPYTPDQIMLQWYDGASWSHRAFWGTNLIGRNLPNMGRLDTEQQRYMGGLPAARGWYRLEVPASYVGLEGKSVSGMAFGAYREGNNPFITWDRSGKSPELVTAPLPLAATTSIWRYANGTNGWAFEQAEQPPANYVSQKKDAFLAYPNAAAGTVPMYRFHNQNSYFYAKSLAYDGNGWALDNVPFYVLGDAATPDSVPLWLYHNNQLRYFLTTDQNEPATLGINNFDGPNPWAYVPPSRDLVPMRPTGLSSSWNCTLTWTDNSNNETGFKIEYRRPKKSTVNHAKWIPLGEVGANVSSFGTTCQSTGRYYRVRAYNSTGNSGYSNEVLGPPNEEPTIQDDAPAPPNSSPQVNIVSPANGDVVDQAVTIYANAFDVDGNGTIAKVEFFANGLKLNEVIEAPYVFVWSNASPGTYNLTAVATDANGATTTSPAVTINIPGPVRTNVALAANGGVASAQNYTQDGVYSGLHFQPSYANDGVRYISPNGDEYWRDENGLPTWLRIDFNGIKLINEIDVYTVRDDWPTQGDPSSIENFTTFGTQSLDVEYMNPQTQAWSSIPGGSISGNNLLWRKFTFSPLATNAIRVKVNASPDNVARIDEVEAWTGSSSTPAPKNAALDSNGGVTTAQNYTQEGVYSGLHFQPLFSNDGIRYMGPSGDRYWRDEHGLPTWLQVDFNGLKTIDTVDIFTCRDDYGTQADPNQTQTFNNYGMISFQVQYWDGSSWLTIGGGTVSGNNLVWRRITFPTVTTSKVRVSVTGTSDGVARLMEVEAWGYDN